MSVTVVNLETGMPTVEAARQKMEQAIRTARARRVNALKLIHGYGSSGRGGAIKRDVQLVLARKRTSGEIRAFVAGEDFSPFDTSARNIIDACPDLRKDKDYSRSNHGVTIVLI